MENCGHISIRMNDQGKYFCAYCGEHMECTVKPRQKMKPVAINLMADDGLIEILNEFADDIEEIPTEEAKSFFWKWDDKIPAKFIRSCVMAGMHYALKHKDNLDVKWEVDGS